MFILREATYLYFPLCLVLVLHSEEGEGAEERSDWEGGRRRAAGRWEEYKEDGREEVVGETQRKEQNGWNCKGLGGRVRGREGIGWIEKEER